MLHLNTGKVGLHDVSVAMVQGISLFYISLDDVTVASLAVSSMGDTPGMIGNPCCLE